MPTTYPDCLSASSEPLDKLAIITLIRFLRLLVHPQLSVRPKLFPPSQSSSCNAQPTMDSLARRIKATSESGQEISLDSGSEICVIPPSPTMNKSPLSLTSPYFAANNTKIPAYGMVHLQSPWSSPLHVVPKSDSTVRPVGGLRRQLNSVTEFDSYPMPYLNDFAHALHGKKIFPK
ncbi:retrovirus-related Pol polyprotein from transposon opus [Trichonephila clavipes]|nr:retrovirus-related Pol polyprotein from transposon opus [Trichonephila clavipes]